MERLQSPGTEINGPQAVLGAAGLITVAGSGAAIRVFSRNTIGALEGPYSGIRAPPRGHIAYMIDYLDTSRSEVSRFLECMFSRESD